MNHQLKAEHGSNVRLAKSDTVAVDMCGCGTLEVHLGVFSLRLPADVVVSVTVTLGAALARRQAILAAPANSEPPSTSSGSDATRGKA